MKTLSRDDAAVLIQDIMDYVHDVYETINRVVTKGSYAFYSNITPEDIVRNLIAYEFQKAYGLVTLSYPRRGSEEERIVEQIRQEVNQELDGRLTELTLLNVKAFVMYDEYREIDIQIRGRDLFIKFYGKVCNQFYNLTSWKS